MQEELYPLTGVPRERIRLKSNRSEFGPNQGVDDLADRDITIGKSQGGQIVHNAESGQRLNAYVKSRMMAHMTEIALNFAMFVLTLAVLGFRAEHRKLLCAFSHMHHPARFNCVF